MASLRIENQTLRFRLKQSELEKLEKEQQFILHNPIGGFEIFMAKEKSVKLKDNGIYTLFITHEDIQKLWDISPSKDGIIFTYNLMNIHFELDIKQRKNKG